MLGGVAKPIWFTDAVWPIADAARERRARGGREKKVWRLDKGREE